MKKAIIVLGIFIIAVSRVLGQHTPMFSQYLFNGLVINPAYALGKDGMRATLYYKKQWAGFDGAPITSGATFQSAFKQEKYNAGVIYLYDEYGLMTQQNFSGNFAYRVGIGNGQLGLGLSAGVRSQYFNRKLLNLVDKDDNTFTQLPTRDVAPLLGMGLYYHTKKYFAGVSVPTWVVKKTSNTSNSLYKRSFLVNTGYNISLPEDITLCPSMLMRMVSGSQVQVDLNALATWKNKLMAGISYRSAELVFLTQYTFQNYSIGYAYALAKGPIGPYTSGSHEFVLRYDLNYGLSLPDPKKF